MKKLIDYKNSKLIGLHVQGPNGELGRIIGVVAVQAKKPGETRVEVKILKDFRYHKAGDMGIFWELDLQREHGCASSASGDELSNDRRTT